MFHPVIDNNGASSAFFWIPRDHTKTVAEIDKQRIFEQLNNKYSLFAHVIDGISVLENLKPGDIIVSTVVEEGIWELKKASDIVV